MLSAQFLPPPHNSLLTFSSPPLQIVREAIFKRCRCHGLSGSCQFQTCWEQLQDFSTVISRLKAIYLHKSAKTSFKNLGSPERPDLYLSKLAPDQDRTSLPNLLLHHDEDRTSQLIQTGPDELLYIYDSPEYCEPQPKLGHHGTKGRVCIPSNNITKRHSKRVRGIQNQLDFADEEEEGPGTCERLCCNRGYQRESILDVVSCNCRFKFCCRVECEDCIRQIDQYYCL